MTILVIAAILLLAQSVKLLLDISTLSVKVVKTKEVTTTPNKEIKNYQFIKGLY